MTARPGSLRIGIVVVAYNAASTLTTTLERIPSSFLPRVEEIIVADDASDDGTFGHAVDWASTLTTTKATILRHTKNLGYGGNQKAAYRIGIEHGLDVLVLLHGDGQYAPECLPDMIAPFESDDPPAAVFGSRMMVPGAAMAGGMPLYKRLGNRVLTRFENTVLGTQLSEFHSGYRAYSTEVLRRIPFEANSDGFDFDTQIIAQVLGAGGRIEEIPIPTYYGDEICYVNGMRYARDVVRDVLEFKLAAKGFGTPEWVPYHEEYEFKEGDGSSHAVLLDLLRSRPPGKVLDLGCSGGLLAERMRALGHHVTGVDHLEIPGVRDRVDAFHQADLDKGLPEGLGSGFDVIIAGDVVEHLSRPTQTLKQVRELLRPGGELLLSVPNFAHWYPRARVLSGRFGYDRRGILDSTHLRFFTRATLRRAVREAGLDVVEERATGLPFGAVAGSDGASTAQRVDAALVRAWPTLFAYQYVLRLTPHAEDVVYADQLDPRVLADSDEQSA